MFTGIVNHVGTISEIVPTSNGLCLAIDSGYDALRLGESITVDGVCLTVTQIKDGVFYCDLSPETLKLTLAGMYQLHQKVNLERSLLAGDRLGGHYVTGHVDQTAKVKDIIRHDDYVEIVLSEFTESDLRYLVTKGSITVNGVSLTINKVLRLPEICVSLMVIPHTLAITNLSMLNPNAVVNIEFDYYAKLIAHQFELYKGVLA